MYMPQINVSLFRFHPLLSLHVQRKEDLSENTQHDVERLAQLLESCCQKAPGGQQKCQKLQYINPTSSPL